MFWRISVVSPVLLLLGLGLFAPGMDADSDPWMSDDARPGTFDIVVDAELCCGPGAPPTCRSTGPSSPLTATLHRRAQVR
jgi:hypothetical protein